MVLVIDAQNRETVRSYTHTVLFIKVQNVLSIPSYTETTLYIAVSFVLCNLHHVKCFVERNTKKIGAGGVSLILNPTILVYCYINCYLSKKTSYLEGLTISFWL